MGAGIGAQSRRQDTRAKLFLAFFPLASSVVEGPRGEKVQYERGDVHGRVIIKPSRLSFAGHESEERVSDMPPASPFLSLPYLRPNFPPCPLPLSSNPLPCPVPFRPNSPTDPASLTPDISSCIDMFEMEMIQVMR